MARQILSGDPRLTGPLAGQGYGGVLAPGGWSPDFSEADPSAISLAQPNPMAVNWLEALHQALPEAAARYRVSQWQPGTPQPGLIHDVGYGYGGPVGGAVADMLQPPRTGPEAAMMFGLPGVGMTGYHASPHVFDRFEPGWRGASFFAGTPEQALAGATAGRNDFAHLVAGIEGEPAAMKMYKADIPDAQIEGLHLTPSEKDWFKALPEKVKGDDALTKALVGSPMQHWDDVYQEHRLADGTYEYTKKLMPSITYEQAVKTGRDVYGVQHAHYGTNTSEKRVAEKVRAKGMGGYLINDEAGLSVGVVDPSIINIQQKYNLR